MKDRYAVRIGGGDLIDAGVVELRVSDVERAGAARRDDNVESAGGLEQTVVLEPVDAGSRLAHRLTRQEEHGALGNERRLEQLEELWLGVDGDASAHARLRG